MPENQKDGRFVGHSKQFSLSEALEDAVQQAAKSQGGVADAMVEFEVVNVRGRSGGIAGFRDVWVEISVGHKGGGGEEPKYTTLAVGEEGGEDAGPGGGEDEPKFTTMAVGEEGGEAAAEQPGGGDVPQDPEGVTLQAAAVAKGGDVATTMAVGEEGGETAA